MGWSTIQIVQSHVKHSSGRSIFNQENAIHKSSSGNALMDRVGKRDFIVKKVNLGFFHCIMPQRDPRVGCHLTPCARVSPCASCPVSLDPGPLDSTDFRTPKPLVCIELNLTQSDWWVAPLHRRHACLVLRIHGATRLARIPRLYWLFGLFLGAQSRLARRRTGGIRDKPIATDLRIACDRPPGAAGVRLPAGPGVGLTLPGF